MTREKEVDEKNIFAAIGRKNADELKARSEFLDKVGALIEKSELISEEKLLKKLGIKQSKVSALVNGHLSEFQHRLSPSLSFYSWMRSSRSE